jgi:class 3 adenylate cyclase/tetratricopeptide (TPR) repeat protein
MERKLATVLFADLVESTALVQGNDPEVVRRRVTQFFDKVAHCITTHGGIVEKFAGDAVMAAFGIPVSHEDDAERAVRAGLAILDTVRELGFEARIGIESGEVVADDGDSTFATGDAVNIAARLQQAASQHEILIGPAAHRLTLGRVQVEDVGPLSLKGRAEPLWVWRALGAESNGAAARGLGAPLVGRDVELDLLRNTFHRAVRDRRAHVFTLYGEPGVGKSRLAHEFSELLEGATVLSGRALPYGEGVTYWPLAEMVKCAAGIADDDPLDEAIEKLVVCCEDEAVADLLGLASGVLKAVHGERSQQEIAWAAREWAERLALDQPLVLLFEDIHWAEDPLLELIEHLASWVREAPLLLLCLARPELLDIRPGWGGGRLRATAIELEPLGRGDSEELVDALLDDQRLSAEARNELLEKTEGNPLFLEETIRMVIEDGDYGAVTKIPDTVQALIAARIDRLPAEQKTLLQRGAVIGRTFWGGALAHLAPEVEEIEEPLDDLLLRDFLLKEPRSTISGETAYRFKHVLIREVAYSGLSKNARANHHARFAEWLRERAGEELLEIRAYHLDQACALLAELDGAPPLKLAQEAAAVLEEAGRRALAREANQSARKLLCRAVDLEPTLARRFRAAQAAWRLDDLPAVSEEMEEVCRAAGEEGDYRIQGRALTALAEVALFRDADLPKARELVDRALALLPEDAHDARFTALHARSRIAWWEADLEDQERYALESLEVARRAGRPDQEASAAGDLAGIYMTRFDFARSEPLAREASELAEKSGSIVARAAGHDGRGYSHLLRGQYDDAMNAFLEAVELYREVSAAQPLGRALNHLGWSLWGKDDLAAAEQRFRESIRVLQPSEIRGTLCESQRALAQLLVEEGKLDEAERFALAARETVGSDDRTSLATTGMALGQVRAAQGRDVEAEQLFRDALDLMEGRDFKRIETELLEPLVQFLGDRGREDEAGLLEPRLEALRAAATTAVRA